MIKKYSIDKILENYEYFICTNNGKRYEFKWKSRIIDFYTCGISAGEVPCAELIPESVEIEPLSAQEDTRVKLTLDRFNELHKDEQIDLQCNCHGFTFANGKYYVQSEFVDFILEDEFDLVEEEAVSGKQYDVVIFRNEYNMPIHSCKFQHDFYLHKEGIRKFSIHRSIEHITKLSDYTRLQISYYKRKSKFCYGICSESIRHNRAGNSKLIIA